MKKIESIHKLKAIEMNYQGLLLLCLLFCFIVSCRESEVFGISLGDTLTQNLESNEHQQLKNIIKRTLDNEEVALKELIYFPCGGASGCYDLGYIITQLIYKIGEEQFVTIITNFDETTSDELLGLVDVGLEYGYNLDFHEAQSKFLLVRSLIKEKGQKIELLRLSYEELQIYDCIYSIDDDDFWNKNIYLATSSTKKSAFVKLKSQEKRIELPSAILKEVNDIGGIDGRISFKKDSIEIWINPEPKESRVLSTHKFVNKVMIVVKNDTSSFELISYCKK